MSTRNRGLLIDKARSKPNKRARTNTNEQFDSMSANGIASISRKQVVHSYLLALICSIWILFKILSNPLTSDRGTCIGRSLLIR